MYVIPLRLVYVIGLCRPSPRFTGTILARAGSSRGDGALLHAHVSKSTAPSWLRNGPLEREPRLPTASGEGAQSQQSVRGRRSQPRLATEVHRPGANAHLLTRLLSGYLPPQRL